MYSAPEVHCADEAFIPRVLNVRVCGRVNANIEIAGIYIPREPTRLEYLPSEMDDTR